MKKKCLSPQAPLDSSIKKCESVKNCKMSTKSKGAGLGNKYKVTAGDHAKDKNRGFFCFNFSSAFS